MKASIKKQWLEALRSGQYKQAKGFLRRLDRNGNLGHCCLGVLCELVMPAIPDSGWLSDHSGTFRTPAGDSHTSLVGPVRDYANLDQRSPRINIPSDHPLWEDGRVSAHMLDDRRGTELAGLNDSGLSFLEIADLIEQYLPVTIDDLQPEVVS
jgi:hypothetical protein